VISESRATLPPPRHPREHWERVAEEAARMIEEVPLYAGRPAPPAQADAGPVSSWLASLATVTKRDLRRGFPRALVRRSCDLKRALAKGEVEILTTSGTTDSRLQVLWEWSWWDPQEREAMRLNGVVAASLARAGFREAVLCTPVCGGAVCHVGKLSTEERTIDGMLFLNQQADPSLWPAAELDRMVEEWNGLAPDGVEADPAYLAALCRHAAQTGRGLHSPAYVALTYEQITRAHRRAIEGAIDSPCFSLYGATESGVLFMECTAGRLHHNARHCHVELVDCGSGLARVIVTTLGRTWMPLLRYEIGDLVRVAPPGPCPCGRPEEGHLLARVEGRRDEALDSAGAAGRELLTPAMIDDLVFAEEPEIEAWQLESQANGGLVLHAVGASGERAAAALCRRLGAGRVRAQREASILPEGSGKYRLVRVAA
jgi:phenylacetate-coenzyme A ligase PaaK-like adenylate-forming protein